MTLAAGAVQASMTTPSRSYRTRSRRSPLSQLIVLLSMPAVFSPGEHAPRRRGHAHRRAGAEPARSSRSARELVAPAGARAGRGRDPTDRRPRIIPSVGTIAPTPTSFLASPPFREIDPVASHDDIHRGAA